METDVCLNVNCAFFFSFVERGIIVWLICTRAGNLTIALWKQREPSEVSPAASCSDNDNAQRTTAVEFLVHILWGVGFLCHLCFLGGSYKMARSKVREWPADTWKPLHFRLNLGSNFSSWAAKLDRDRMIRHMNMIGVWVRYSMSVLLETLLTLTYSCVGCLLVEIMTNSLLKRKNKNMTW